MRTNKKPEADRKQAEGGVKGALFRIYYILCFILRVLIELLRNFLFGIQMQNYYTGREMRNVLNSMLKECFALLEIQGFKKTPFVNGKFGRIKKSLLSYEFYKISGEYMLYLRFDIPEEGSWIECRHDVYEIPDMPVALEELEGHYGFFGNPLIGSTLSLANMSGDGMFRMYKLSYTTPLEILRKMERTCLKRKIIRSILDIDIFFGNLINTHKRASWYRLLVCSRYGVILPTAGQERTAVYQKWLEGLTPDQPEYEEKVRLYGSYFNVDL